MKRTNLSLGLFLLSVILLMMVTVGESALRGMSTSAERMISFLLLVLPAACGAVAAAAGLRRRERRAWLALTLLALNTLFALFHLVVVLFAG